MSEEPVTLELHGRLVRGMQEEMREFRDQLREFRDQMTVQTAILLRLESGQNTMTEQLRAMASQHQRTDRRLIALDERIRALEDERR
jgi:septal ring factor EnvC (AmiA/AmiB activator)